MDENQINKRPRIILTVLATIGSISIIFVILFFSMIAYTIHSISGGMKNLSSSFNNPSTSSGANFTVPAGSSEYIAGVKLTGEISAETANEVLEKLNTAKEDKNVVGVLFEVSSPGGAVVASQEMYDAISEVRSKKPVVVYVRDMAASGSYYSSASADKIIANRGSLIGSIGVILSNIETDKLISFLKLNPVTLKTGALKDAGSPLRPMNENDKKYLQSLIENMRSQFVADVKAGRKLPDSTLSYMSDGRVVLATEALKLKLIDGIGTKQTALEEITKIAQLKKTPNLFYYENIQPFSELFSQKFIGGTSKILSETAKNLIINTEKNTELPKAQF
ncbi:signal peptide peptidase SppA [Fluviispira sanaruensis]|uniref:Signal peptide peptidase SppA n=1 Tax=Fluviispira sanaruensis TaxID=2493639 RepID=A0A4P2VKE7_FLUSA|nr:signal peptide peptidase SppA [Fluviispira sanaruensis]BBH53241.1 signal peptide peptidase SppA [Fluviispira sanaruensis]